MFSSGGQGFAEEYTEEDAIDAAEDDERGGLFSSAGPGPAEEYTQEDAMDSEPSGDDLENDLDTAPDQDELSTSADGGSFHGEVIKFNAV